MENIVKISMYINEADQWRQRPLYLEVLQMLFENGVAGGTVIPAIAGFTLARQVATQAPPAMNVKGKLPLVVQFIDSAERVGIVLPELRRMVGARLIIQEEVEIIE